MARKIQFRPNKEDFIKKYNELESSRLMGEYYGVNFKTILRFAHDIGYCNNSKNNYWKPSSKEEFILKYNKLKSAEKMAKNYNVCKLTILKYAKKINYTNIYRPNLNDSQKEYICKNYKTKSSKDISNDLNISTSLVKKIWRENNYLGKDTRMYYMNFNYFEKIDSPDKSYFLGVIASDGCVYNRKNHQGMLSFKFHIQEKDIIDNFLYWTNSNYKPAIYDNKIDLQINSNKIVNDLKRYNIVNRKTWMYEPYPLTNELMWHFLRGYFDGDGSIYYIKNSPEKLSNWYITYCGNEKTMIFFRNFLINNNINARLYKDNRPEKYTMDFYNLRIRENSSKKLFLGKLYFNSEKLRLNKKYTKALNFLNHYNKKVN